MEPTRRARLAAVIQQELSQVVPREVKDPRIPALTFTDVQVTQDGSHATVFVAILGGALAAPKIGAETGQAEGAPLTERQVAQRMADCLAGLSSASGFLRRHLATVLTVRHIPSIVFREDKGFENTLRVQELLREISKEPPRPAEPADDSKTEEG